MRDQLAVAVNELLRSMMRAGMHVAGHVTKRSFDRRVRRFSRDQADLARRYGISSDVPIRCYDETVGAAVDAYAAAHKNARFAYTSGSTSKPKRIAFTNRRLRSIKMGSFSVAARMVRALAVPRMGLFILAGLSEDDSLTALIIRDAKDRPGYVSGLLMPAKYLATPILAQMIDEYGATAVRLWLLMLSNPGLVYSTNPSTLALFLSEIYDDWEGSTRLVREYAENVDGFDDAMTTVVRRIAGSGWRRRFERVANADAPLPVADMVPGFRIYCCWDGGYVRPFIDRIQAFLPAQRFTLVPMYSMSTETVETLNYFDGDVIRFLPVASGVFYEFLPEGSADDPALLISGDALEPGKTYTMVVSDAYGLRRYQTEDLFECVARVGDVPDLHFRRRRGLAFSFTGEKITDVHVIGAFTALREQFSLLVAEGVQLTCIPSRPEGATVPEYRLVLAYPSRHAPRGLHNEAERVVRAFDTELGVHNREFSAKVASGRLGPSRVEVMPYDALAARLDAKLDDSADSAIPGKLEHAEIAKRGWDTQFKLLPLYRRLWQDYGFDAP